VLPFALLGYGILQALVLLHLLSWIRQQGFTMSLCGFPLGASAIGALPLRMLEKGDAPLIASIAPYFFVAANAVVLLLTLATLRLAVLGRLVAQPATRA
jgi:tellurite resistance protein